jgi:hypothetical protein
VLAALERIGDLLRERSLLRPRLEAGQRGREGPAGTEEPAHGALEPNLDTGQHTEHLFVTACRDRHSFVPTSLAPAASRPRTAAPVHRSISA